MSDTPGRATSHFVDDTDGFTHWFKENWREALTNADRKEFLLFSIVTIVMLGFYAYRGLRIVFPVALGVFLLGAFTVLAGSTVIAAGKWALMNLGTVVQAIIVMNIVFFGLAGIGYVSAKRGWSWEANNEL